MGQSHNRPRNLNIYVKNNKKFDSCCLECSQQIRSELKKSPLILLWKREGDAMPECFENLPLHTKRYLMLRIKFLTVGKLPSGSL